MNAVLTDDYPPVCYILMLYPGDRIYLPERFRSYKTTIKLHFTLCKSQGEFQDFCTPKGTPEEGPDFELCIGVATWSL